MSEISKVLAISWERHRRTVTLCRQLEISLIVLESEHGRLLRYLELVSRTLRAVLSARPAVLLVQNPSVALTILAVLLRPWFHYRLVVDAHNEAIEPYIYPNWPMPSIARWLMRYADLTIVTNSQLAAVVSAAGGEPGILPDAIPEPPQIHHAELAGACSICVVNTFAPDEPLDRIADAAGVLGDDYRFYVTGAKARLPQALAERAPANVEFCGFLSEADYWALLGNCDLVIDLSCMPNCLVCGAYEAIAVGTPMILTDNPASRELFGDFCLLTMNDAPAVAQAVREGCRRRKELRRKAAEGRAVFEAHWQNRANELRRRLVELCG